MVQPFGHSGLKGGVAASAVIATIHVKGGIIVLDVEVAIPGVRDLCAVRSVDDSSEGNPVILIFKFPGL